MWLLEIIHHNIVWYFYSSPSVWYTAAVWPRLSAGLHPALPPAHLETSQSRITSDDLPPPLLAVKRAQPCGRVPAQPGCSVRGWLRSTVSEPEMLHKRRLFPRTWIFLSPLLLLHCTELVNFLVSSKSSSCVKESVRPRTRCAAMWTRGMIKHCLYSDISSTELKIILWLWWNICCFLYVFGSMLPSL